jgi:hypothetical protein
MDKKLFTVGVLSLSALFLLVANLMVPRTADAQVAIKDRDYQAVTGRMPKGGDALYLTDNRTGKMAVFAYDNASRSLKAVAVKDVSDAFSPRGAAGRK